MNRNFELGPGEPASPPNPKLTRAVLLYRMHTHGERLYVHLATGRHYIGLSIFSDNTIDPALLRQFEAEHLVSFTSAIAGVVEYAPCYWRPEWAASRAECVR